MGKYHKAILVLMLISILPVLANNTHALQANTPLYNTVTGKQFKPLSTPIPIVNITLTNGTIYNFTNIDDAIMFMYDALKNKGLSFSNISNITVIPFSTYLKYVNNETNHTTPIPSYSVFFVKVPYLEKKNYTGSIIPVVENETLEYSNILTRSLLYGPIGEINITDINSNTYVADGQLNLLVFFDSRRANISLTQLEIIKGNLSTLTSKNVKVFAIDVNENLTATREFAEENDLPFVIANDANITILGKNVSGLYSYFGFNTIIPASVLVNKEHILLWKKIGLVNSNELNMYIDMIGEGIDGLLKYKIIDVYVEKPKVDSTSDIVVILSEGYGNLESINVSYKFIYNNGTESEFKKANVESTDGITYRDAIYIQKDVKTLVIQVSIKNQFGSDSKTVQISIEQEREKEQSPETPILQIVLIVILIVIIVAGYISYRKTSS